MLPPFVRGQAAGGFATPVDFRERAALEIDGFPEYMVDATADQRQRIEALAEAIVRSRGTRDPIFAFRVEGHADTARRIPPAERTQFENDVSADRAQSGFDLLVEAIRRKSGDNAFADAVAKRSAAFGLGSRQLKVRDARSEADFRRNRRVVFILREVTMIPRPPPRPEPPSSVIENRYTVRLITGAVASVEAPLPTQFPKPGLAMVTVTLQIKDLIDRKAALFNVAATGVGLGAGPFPAGGTLMLNAGPEVPFRIFRLLGRSGSPPDLRNFAGSVTVFQDFGAGIGPLSKGGTLSFSFDALERSGVNHVPTVIPVPSGNFSLSVPGIDTAAMPVGIMTMIGQPISF
jgi:hypothetical protein